MTCKYCLGVLLTLFFFGNTSAQDTLRHRHSDATYWCVKLPVANLVDPNSPNLLAGAERRLDSHNAVQLLAGFSVDPDRFNAKQNWYSVFNGYRLKGEYRRYFHLRRNVSLYLAADFFYTTTSHYISDYFVSQATGADYLDNYYLRKKMFGSDIKWGFQRKVRRHFVLEAFAGLGYKYKIVKETGRKVPSDPLAPPPPYTDINLSSISNETGSYGTINMPVNFVIGYIFR